MIDMKKIKDLIKLMVANDLTELDLEGEGERVTLKRELGGSNIQHFTMPVSSTVMSPVANADAASPAAAEGSANGQVQDGTKIITSPMVGTFYTASSPDAKPFVSVGDRVSEDTVVCIIEAMKVFNEIKSEITGTIEKIQASSGQTVEFEQPLFLVRPD